MWRLERETTRIARCLLVALSVALGLGCEAERTDGTVVGVLLDYTGNAAANGFNLERGVLLAAQMMDEAHAGRPPWRFVFRDSRGDPQVARREALALAEQGAVLVIGPSGDELVAAVAPVLHEREVLLFSPTATRGFDDGVWFRMTPGNAAGASAASLYGESLAKELLKRDVTRVGVVAENDIYHSDLAAGFISTYEWLGGEVAVRHDVEGGVLPSADASFSDPTIMGFVIALNLLPAAELISNVAAVTTPPQWFLTPRLKSEVFLLNTQRAAVEGAMGVSPRIPFLHQDCASASPDQCFLTRFEQMWDDRPFEETYFIFDATAVSLMALDRVLRTHGGQAPREPLAAAILSIAGQGGAQLNWYNFPVAVRQNELGQAVQYSGLTGPILFSSQGERRGGATTTWTIHEGRFVDEP